MDKYAIIPITILFIIGLLMPILVYFLIKDSNECRAKGGVPTRAGCIKKEVFINE